MEAETSHDPPSAHWSLRRAAGVIHSQSEGLRTRGANDTDSSV